MLGHAAFRCKDGIAIGIFLLFVILLRNQYKLLVSQILRSSNEVQVRYQAQSKYILRYHNLSPAIIPAPLTRIGKKRGKSIRTAAAESITTTTTTTTHGIPLSESSYKRGGPVIACLVTNDTMDVSRLVFALKGLHHLKGDIDSSHPAPVLIFNEGNLLESQKQALIASVPLRPVAFPVVNFVSFPLDFDLGWEKEGVTVADRPRWGYVQMNRFWLTMIWRHPAVEPFGSVMRIDSDSCFMVDNEFLPQLKTTMAVYHSQYIGFAKDQSKIKGLYDFTVEWMDRVGKMPGNPMMWQFVKTKWERDGTLPVFRTNFEVIKRQYMNRKDVRKYVDALTEREPYGVLRHGWDYAAIRFIMAAVFTTNELIIMSRPKGYAHDDLCDPLAYEARFGVNN